jgi:hypothetical protein
MNFTFGIITSGNQDERIYKIINSIRFQNIPNYEIIIVGNSKIKENDVNIIQFDEGTKKNWITRKKNLITNRAKYENIVYSHDYIKLDVNWYNGYLKFGDKFLICMNKIENLNGERYRDWSIDAMASISHIVGDRRYERLLPYEDCGLSKIMYISGAYWVAKRDFMKKFPLDERLCWGEAEDIEWSHRVRKNINFSINAHSTVKLLSYKHPSYVEMKNDLLEKFLNMSDLDMKLILDHAENYYKRNHGQ